MFGDLKHNTKIEMEGNYFKCFLASAAPVAAFIFFFLYCISAVYLFIFNTSFFERIGVFYNAFTLWGACIAAVLVGFVLLLFAYYEKYRKDFMFLSLFGDTPKKPMSVSDVIKVMLLYDVIFIKKAFIFLVFILPSVGLSTIIYSLLINGISTVAFSVLTMADGVVLVSGVISAAVFSRRYSLCVYEYAREPELSLRKIIKKSILSMDGKCVKLFLLRVRHIPKRLSSLLILPGIYCIPYCRGAETLFAMGKTNPYMSKRRYTEKPVVFYLEKRTT